MAAPTTDGHRAATGARAAATSTSTTTAGQAPSPAASQAGQQPVVPLPLVVVTVAAVGLVTVVCAVVSYSHIRDLAIIAGMGSLASWLPLGVDGLVVASSCSLIVDHHLKRPGQALAWIGVALGLAGSLAANVLAVDPDLVSLRAVRWVLAGYTPAALAVSGHLLFRMLGEQHRPAGPPVAAHGDTGDSADAEQPAPAGSDQVRRAATPYTGDMATSATAGDGGSRPVRQDRSARNGPVRHDRSAGNRLVGQGGDAGKPVRRGNAGKSRQPPAGKRRASFDDFAATAAELESEGLPVNRTLVTRRLRQRGLSLANDKADYYLDKLQGDRKAA